MSIRFFLNTKNISRRRGVSRRYRLDEGGGIGVAKLSCILLLFVVSILKSQTDSTSEDYSKTHSYMRINYENDFFTATDNYYTQGILTEYVMPIIKKSPLAKTLAPLNKKSHNYYGWAFEQDCFTPRSIRYDTLNYTERPYAASAFLTHFLISINPVKKRRLTTKLDLGLIGPCAQCELEQKSIHAKLDNIAPLGWQYQIATDYIVNYSIKFEQGLIVKKYFELVGIGEVRAGTLYDDASAGVLFRIGLMNSYFKHLGIIKNNTKNKFQCYFTFKGNAKGVGYNAVMQGGMFYHNSIYTIPADKITRGVFQYYNGITIAYKRFSVDYGLSYLSPEFNIGLYHAWGHCNITACF